MEARYNGQNGNLTPPPPPLETNKRLQKIIGYYSMKFHLITIPVGLIMAIIQLKFAITYFGQCTMQPMINIYLIVSTAVQIAVMLLTLVGVIISRCIYPRVKDEHKKGPHIILIVVLIFTFVLFLFNLAWLIAGSVWIFGAKANGVQGTNPNATTTYCQSSLFNAAFTLIIIAYVIHGLIILRLIVKCVCGKKQETNQPSIAMNSMENKI